MDFNDYTLSFTNAYIDLNSFMNYWYNDSFNYHSKQKEFLEDLKVSNMVGNGYILQKLDSTVLEEYYRDFIDKLTNEVYKFKQKSIREMYEQGLYPDDYRVRYDSVQTENDRVQLIATFEPVENDNEET